MVWASPRPGSPSQRPAPLWPSATGCGEPRIGVEVPDSSVAPYNDLAWHDFFIGTIGTVAAALTGLLFVAISINLEQILKYPQLPGRAAGTLGILVSALVVSGFALAPGQGSRTLGIEIAAARRDRGRTGRVGGSWKGDAR